MSDEFKTCDCKEKCIEKIKEFTFIAGAVFVGATLAILLSASILRPKCPCPRMMMGPHPRMERPLPPPPHMMRDYGWEAQGLRGPDARPHRMHHCDFGYRGEHPQRFDRADRGDYRMLKKHHRFDKPQVPEDVKKK